MYILISDSRWMIVSFLATSKNNLLGNDNGLVWIVFVMSVWHVFGSHFVLSFCLKRSFCQLSSWWVWWLYHLPYQLIYKNFFRIQKKVSLQRFFLKGTKLVMWLPWPSRKQPTISISSNSNLVFLASSILSAKTDPLFCVDLVFGRSSTNVFWTSSSRVSFRNAGQSIHSSVLVVEINYPLHII